MKWVACVLAMVVMPCYADETAIKNPSRFDFRTSYYEDGSTEYGLSFDRRLKGNERFRMDVAWTKYELTLDEVQMNNLRFSLSGDPMEQFSMTGELEYWGNNDVLSTMQGKLTLNKWKSDTVTLRLHAKYRRISLYGPDVDIFNQPFNLKSTFNVDNIGLGGSLLYISENYWSHQLYGNYQYYSEDLQSYKDDTERYYFLLLAWLQLQAQNTDNIRRRMILGLLHQLTLLSYVGLADQVSASSGFDDFKIGYELGLNKKKASFTFNTGTGRSAMTGDDFTDVVFAATYFGKRNQAGISLGYVFTGDNQFNDSDWVVQVFFSLGLN